MKKFMTVLAVLALVAFAAPAFAATNPFMDVPAGHWAYDAVAQLASRGVASGYPDGAYKGTQPATRYEMASMVARALAQMDMEKASRQDVELLKRLVLEFKNELDALGVKVNDLDKRVAVLEDGIGGWNIRGIFQFDAKFGSSDEDEYAYNDEKKNEFTKERLRLFLTKQIDENTYFYAQYRTGDNGAGGDGKGDQNHMRWSHIYVDTKLPWEIGLRVGRFTIDFEKNYGLYIDENPLFGDFGADGFMLTKSWNTFKATAAVVRNGDIDTFWEDATQAFGGEYGVFMYYILDLNWTPNEKLFMGATGYWMVEDSSNISPVGIPADADIHTYGIYAGYNFTPAIGLKGIYYFQNLGEGFQDFLMDGEGDPKAWKLVLDVKQEALKFTSLWVEYSEQDNAFLSISAQNRYGIEGANYPSVLDNLFPSSSPHATTKAWFVKAVQQWNEKWNTQLRFAHADVGVDWVENATEWGVGAGYQYTPAIYFELLYDQVDYGNSTRQEFNGKESVVRFRTSVSF